MIRFGILSLLLMMMVFSGRAHDFYISIAKIEYNSESHSFEFSIKLTAHDLEKVFEDQGLEDLKMGEKNESPKMDAYLKKYLDAHFWIELNGKHRLSNQLIGKEVQKDEDMWIYVEVPCIKGVDIRSIDVLNSVLCDEFPKQQNHNHLKMNGRSYALVCTTEKRSGSIYSKE